MLTHYKRMLIRSKSLKKNLLDKSQLPLIKITHRKLIIWYISNIRNQNFNIFSIKLRIIKIKINEFMLSAIFSNLVAPCILIYQKKIFNKNNEMNQMLLKVLGKQGIWWKNICLPVSILNNSFNRSDNSYRWIHRVIYNLLYIIKMKKSKIFGCWSLLPQLTTNYYVNKIVKLIFSLAIKEKKASERYFILKQYYNNLIQFKLTKLKTINNYNLKNVVNKTIYPINKQIYSKIKKLKKKTSTTKQLRNNNTFKNFNNNLRWIEDKLLLIWELICAYNSMILINKKLQYISKKWGRLLNKQVSYFLRNVKGLSYNKISTVNISLIQKLNGLINMIGRKSLLVIIKLFRKNKNIFKYSINITIRRLLCKLSHLSKIIRRIKRILLSEQISLTTINKHKRSFYSYKTLNLTKNGLAKNKIKLINFGKKKKIISKLINKYKQSKIISSEKIDILTYIYNKLLIISKKKWGIIKKFRNKYKKEKILINKKIKTKIIYKNKIIIKNKLNEIDKKKIAERKSKKILPIKCKRLALILVNKFKKKLITLKAIDINKIFRIVNRLPRYSYKIYSIKKWPKKSTLQIKRSKLFRIWKYTNFTVKRSSFGHKKNIGIVIRHKRKQYSIIKKKIDIIAWKNRKYFPQKKISQNITQLLHISTSINRAKSLKKKWHRNFFLTAIGSSFIINSFHNKYMAVFVAKSATTTLFKNNSNEFDVMWIGYQINNYALGYLYLKNINSIQTAVWNYWSIYFLQKSIVSLYSRQLFYIVRDRKRFSPLKGHRNKMKLVCWKKGQTWINKLLLKRRLYSVRHWSIWKRKFPRKRLYKIYRNHKLPDKFYNNKFYMNLWYTNYNIRSCRRILYKWRYRRNLVLKSLRFFYGQLNSRSIAKLLVLVNRRVSIYNNRYDRFFCKLDNKLACQAYNFGLAQTSFWSNQFVQNGWLTVSNPDKDIMFLNYLLKIKKFIFPINLFDPKNIYWMKQEKSYKFEQYKYLMMPQRKQNFLLTAGDLINFIYSSETFNTKFNDGNMLRMNLPINKNILNGETYEYSVDNKFKIPTLIQREVYNMAILLFNPRIQDLSISTRINAEKILFTIRNVK